MTKLIGIGLLVAAIIWVLFWSTVLQAENMRKITQCTPAKVVIENEYKEALLCQM